MTTENFNKLTDAELERLSMLSEECGEVMQAIGKILRHGYEDTHPNNIDADGKVINKDAVNRNDLEKEMGDVLGLINYMTEMGDVKQNAVTNSMITKIERSSKYMHHQDPARVKEHIQLMKKLWGA